MNINFGIGDDGSFWFIDECVFVHGAECYGGNYFPVDYQYSPCSSVFRDKMLFALVVEE